MKLGKKIRYIILPVIVMVSFLVSAVYYDVYKTQIIENKVSSLDDHIENILLRNKYELVYLKSYLRQKIDSKEAALIFNAKERKEVLAAPYVTQFLNRFIDNDSRSNNIVNDFVIYNSHGELIIHVNTQDPFAEPVLKKQTKKILERVNDKSTDDQKIAQYYYFLDDTKDADSHRKFNVIQVFSPYLLTSKQFYDKHYDLYLVQAEVNFDFIETEIKRLMEAHHGYLQYKLTAKSDITEKISLTSTPFQLKDNDFYQGGFGSTLLDIVFTLDKNYFSENLNNILMKLILLNIAIIILSYLLLVWIIEKQIILPITALAKSIKEVEATLVVDLKPLTSNDEVSDLNQSYISLISKINTLANNDPLTGLSNRGSFNEKLSSIVHLNKNSETYIALFFIDLDNFKSVNDTFGHDTGDRLLVVFSQRLTQTLRADDRFVSSDTINSIARLGGDEFVILMNGLPSVEAIESIGKRICDLFQNGFTIDNDKYDVHASIGIAYSNDTINDGETLLNQADDAMYLAKRDGKNNVKLFSSDIKEKMDKEKMIETELTNALNNNSLFLLFMPAYNTTTLELKGYEALLRCPALMDIDIGPDLFIPISEKSDLILTVDLWVAENVLIKLEDLVKKTGFNGFLSINISSKSLRNDLFYTRFKQLLASYNVNVKQIELEITESCLLPDDQQAITRLTQIKSLGVRVAIDDFGTGYTSFSQLVHYPLDTLKIDRSFVKNLHSTPVGKKPTLDIIFELAKVYQLEVIVEGVETEADFDHIKNLGCDIVQGFYFTMPRRWSEVVSECGLLAQTAKNKD
ncbi:MAG: diguanylate cyclase (GGDEF)-like protein [Psychromonas sp.]|jgi:diguanylate cyclase (GGDEF)-like protein|uniref:putative bifunctional diguanylate cyclase/phosphodiesterase n=1 Tax=Psychromonas sp. TaxID=1884585 RepID=UPI0039E5ECE6